MQALKLDGKGLVDARFFGQHDRAWVREENCYLYSKELPHQVKNKKKAGAKGICLFTFLIFFSWLIVNVLKLFVRINLFKVQFGSFTA